MDTVITFEEASLLLVNPPAVAPRPNFNNLRALRKWLEEGLKRLTHPTAHVMGWAGLVMVPVLYALIEAIPFTAPTNPGLIPPYPRHRNLPRSEQANIARQHQIDMNYWNSWLNIVRAVFVCLDTCIDDAFKTSNQPGQTGWNATMSIAEIFAQLTNTYGQPTPAMIFENDSIFRQLHDPRAPPELLFRRLENCQEIATLGAVGYTPAQMLANTTHLLQVCGHYTLEFREWIARPAHTQTYAYLKTFIQEAYSRRLQLAGQTTGEAGFAGSALEEESDDEVADLTEQVAHLAAAGHANAGVANEQLAIFNQTLEDMRVNQHHMEHQLMMMASGFGGGGNNNNNNNQRASRPQRPNVRNAVQRAQQMQYAPQQQTQRRAPAQFPAHQQQTMAGMANHFQGRGRNGGGRGRGGRGGRGARGGNAPAPPGFRTAGQHRPNPAQRGAERWAAAAPTRNGTAAFSNRVKTFPNWNACYSCGFDVEEWHHSGSCPNRRGDHQNNFDRNNWQSYQEEGWNFCRRAMHKDQLPMM